MLISASVNLWLIVAPLLVVQYGLAIFCLTRLAYCNISVKAYVLWNLFILLIFFVGSIVFLTYYFLNRTKLRTAPPTADAQPDTLEVDDEPPAPEALPGQEESPASETSEDPQQP